jgi:hypothetical protein
MTVSYLWRKHALPSGKVPWHGRELDFTPEWLASMSDAFTAGALNIVPFTIEDTRWGPVDDPELIRGTVRSLQVVSDGLEAVVQVDELTDTIIDLDKEYPVGSRIISRYETPGSREYPAVFAMLYLTEHPGIPGLRPWQREPS